MYLDPYQIQVIGKEMFAQESDLPSHQAISSGKLIVLLTSLASGVTRLIFVFIRKALPQNEIDIFQAESNQTGPQSSDDAYIAGLSA